MKNPGDLLSIGVGFLLGMVLCYFLMSNEPVASAPVPANRWQVAQVTNRTVPFGSFATNEGLWITPHPKPNLLHYDKLHPQPKPSFIHYDGATRWGPQPNVLWPDNTPFRQYDRSLIDFRYQLPDR